MEELCYKAEQFQNRRPKFNKDDIRKYWAMCTSVSCILFYGVLCYIFKHIPSNVPATYDLFNAMAGTFMFVVFVCWRRPRKIIVDFWNSKKTEEEGLDTMDMPESLAMTNGTVS
jgi:hypothetical protein